MGYATLQIFLYENVPVLIFAVVGKALVLSFLSILRAPLWRHVVCVMCCGIRCCAPRAAGHQAICKVEHRNLGFLGDGGEGVDCVIDT